MGWGVYKTLVIIKENIPTAVVLLWVILSCFPNKSKTFLGH